MKKYLEEKGITLIALVITIIVMLILAGVIINLTLGENGIFTTAQQAAKNYTDAQNKEMAGIQNFTQTVDKTIQDVTQNWDTLASKAKPGDYVKYDGGNGYTGLWQVLYNDDTYGLQIISADTVTDSFKLGGMQYNNAIDILNEECRKYINTLYATSGRCVGSNPLSPDDAITDTVTLQFEYNETTDSGMKVGDKNDAIDKDAMKKATNQNESGIHNLGKDYWLASRFTDSKSEFATFYIKYMTSSGSSLAHGFCTIKPTKLNTGAYWLGIRPVITLISDIQTNNGTGSINDAFELMAK